LGYSTNMEMFVKEETNVCGQPVDSQGPVYLDCAATTPIDPAVMEVCVRYMVEEYGNAGSRTHEFGTRANKAVQLAREQVAAVVDARREDVIFTSGATEANNLAILGLAPFGKREGRRHIVSTQIEHKAVLEPLEALVRCGFEVTLIPPTSGGWVEPDAVLDAVRLDTLLVSVMHVNNETGVIQPIAAIADRLEGHAAFLHTDAAQGYGKDLEQLRHPRLDMISVSGHKIFAPKGIGTLILRMRDMRRAPLEPLLHGGGQERGLRPGTLPVHLVAGLGAAAEAAISDWEVRRAQCIHIREQLLSAIEPLKPSMNADTSRVLPNILNFSLEGFDSEAVMLAVRAQVAISNGSACTSHSYTPSHVLRAIGIDEERISGALRWSWCHLTPPVEWGLVVDSISVLCKCDFIDQLSSQ
jgi:cysteine desulfurase